MLSLLHQIGPVRYVICSQVSGWPSLETSTCSAVSLIAFVCDRERCAQMLGCHARETMQVIFTRLYILIDLIRTTGAAACAAAVPIPAPGEARREVAGRRASAAVCPCSERGK
jgi:hypothetical protein